jgi:hypothetical protein
LPHTDRISRFVAGNSPGDRGGLSPRRPAEERSGGWDAVRASSARG